MALERVEPGPAGLALPQLPPEGLRLAGLALSLAGASALFLLWGARGDWGFVLALRGARLGSLLLVGAAVGVATVLFQTVSGNRILTPGVMGFDALFVLLQTGLVAGLGGLGLSALPAATRFGMELALLLGGSLLLFGTLLGGRPDIQRTVLAGIVMGVLFRSLSGFLQRMIDPNDFAIVQGATFARFNATPPGLLGIAALLGLAAMAGAWRLRHRLDVLALGRDHAVGLGLDHRRSVLGVLALVTVLVSVSTALVGPVTFLGLLVAALAHEAARTHRHAILLPAAALVAGLVLVGGQVLLERALGWNGTLGAAVEFAGGLAFLLLVLREARR